jgi:hypothetical protein
MESTRMTWSTFLARVSILASTVVAPSATTARDATPGGHTYAQIHIHHFHSRRTWI